jgi:Fe-only nitrogenase accessory protein AnfO
MRIATYLDAEGKVGDFLSAGSICVYDKLNGRWQQCSSTPLVLNEAMSLAEMKRVLGEAVHPISQCQVFLVRELRGIFRVFLEDWGFRVWKSSGALEWQLEQVAEQELKASQQKPELLPQPEGDPQSGHYHINLIELIEKGVPQVSREILLPFFDTVPFTQLEVISDHLPRWLPFELDELGLRIESQTPASKGEGMHIMIKPAYGACSCPKGRRKRNFSCNCGG